MADDRKFELDELLVRPGTYFNPQTEVLVMVDDSTSVDTEIFNMEEFERKMYGDVLAMNYAVRTNQHCHPHSE